MHAGILATHAEDARIVSLQRGARYGTIRSLTGLPVRPDPDRSHEGITDPRYLRTVSAFLRLAVFIRFANFHLPPNAAAPLCT
jgi:hypothetical protein